MSSGCHRDQFSCDSSPASVGEPCLSNRGQFLLHTRHFPRDTERLHSPMDPQSATRQTTKVLNTHSLAGNGFWTKSTVVEWGGLVVLSVNAQPRNFTSESHPNIFLHKFKKQNDLVFFFSEIVFKKPMSFFSLPPQKGKQKRKCIQATWTGGLFPQTF